MIRTIYEVYAKVVDANGAYNILTGYPKTFDSRSYMCKRDDRQIQTVILMTAAGQIIDRQTIGKIVDDPDPEPTPEE